MLQALALKFPRSLDCFDQGIGRYFGALEIDGFIDKDVEPGHPFWRRLPPNSFLGGPVPNSRAAAAKQMRVAGILEYPDQGYWIYELVRLIDNTPINRVNFETH